jgi:hypothetical protein
MLNYEDARAIVAGQIKEGQANADNLTLVIQDERTIEKVYGWMFFYTSKKWVETGNLIYRIAGNSPIIVDRITGKMTSYYSSVSVEDAFKRFEQENGYSS